MSLKPWEDWICPLCGYDTLLPKHPTQRSLLTVCTEAALDAYSMRGSLPGMNGRRRRIASYERCATVMC